VAVAAEFFSDMYISDLAKLWHNCPAATTSYMICAETTKIRALTVVQQWVWRAYQPFIPPQLPNIMLQAESVYLDPVSYKTE